MKIEGAVTAMISEYPFKGPITQRFFPAVKQSDPIFFIMVFYYEFTMPV